MTTLRADCFKFSPNIFIQTKCQNCFRTKEVHSADALDNCKVTRKVLKCGYLFVAPDWDFSLYINRSKRWQRRWFVLYDDGELTYSVDEYPDTIPQAVIDMNKILEVSDAEDITGNQYSIAITANEKVHFVKGTSKEEKKWWFDVLSRFPKFTIRSNKPNRNTSFSVGKMSPKIDEVIRNNKNSRNGIYKNYDSSKEIKNTHDIYWKDYEKHASNDDVFHTTEYRAPKKDVIIQLKPTNSTETNASSSPVNSNTLIQKSNIKAPIILNKCNINVDNCDNKKMNTSCDASRMRTSIAELESISVQACQLTNELVCCRKELIELRRKIKDKEENIILPPNDVISNEQFNVDLFKKRELSCVSSESIDSNHSNYSDHTQPKQSKQIEIETIRKLKLELKEAQSNYDYLEIAYERLTKKISEMEKMHESELNLMNDRVNDLTCKLISSERLLRLAKQKIAKHEARQERRRSSLKGKN